MSSPKAYLTRIKKLQKSIPAQTIALFSSPSQVVYFTGFEYLVPHEREAFFACTKTSATLIYTSFSPVSQLEFLNYLPGTFPNQLKRHIETIMSETGANTVLFDPETLFVTELDSLSEIPELKHERMQENPALALMQIKDSEEKKNIATACQITHEVFETVQAQLSAGVTELEVAERIQAEFAKAGAKKLAFPLIVAFGPNSAKPHHQPGETKLEQEMPVLIDMGCRINNYCSDMTRTFWFGETPSTQFQKISAIVLKAYELALAAFQRKGSTPPSAKKIDNAARVYISNQGFGDQFIHTTGHGLGLDIHESPSLNWNNSQELLPGMAVTVEPGIYLEGEFGVRHENTVLVTKDGVKVL